MTRPERGMKRMVDTEQSRRRFTKVAIRDRLLRQFEAVADATQGLQILWMARVELNFLAEAADVDIDRSRGDERGVPPHGIEQLIASHNAAAMGCQVFQKTEFAHGGKYVLAAHLHGHGGDINFQVG